MLVLQRIVAETLINLDDSATVAETQVNQDDSAKVDCRRNSGKICWKCCNGF